MKKKYKKIINFLLCIALLIGMVPTTGYAQEASKYMVFFDPNGDAKVAVNGSEVNGGVSYDFTAGSELTFTLTQPDFRQDATPIVEIREYEVNQDEWPIKVYRSDLPEDDSYRISLTGNTFSFTPTSSNPLEVEIWWSEFDAFGGTEEKPILVMIDCIGEGTIGLEAEIAQEDYFVFTNFTKVRVPAEKNALTLTWEEGKAPVEIRVEGGDNLTEDQWLILSGDALSGNQCTIPLTQTEGENNYPKGFYYVQVDFGGGNSGEGGNGEGGRYSFDRLQTELNETFLAFGDVNGDGYTTEDDIKYGVMRELYDGFRVKEGRYQKEGEALGLIEDFNKQDPTNLNSNMERLLTFVSGSAITGSAITAKDKNDTTHDFYEYQIDIVIDKLYENRQDTNVFPGENDEVINLSEPIVLTARAFLIDMENSSEQVIIKVKDQYFVRDAYSERENGNEPENKDDLEDFEGLNAKALIIVADFDRVEDIVLFGNYAHASEMFSDETADAYFASGFATGDGMKYLGDKFVVYKPNFLGVTINGTGETKSPLAWSVESSLSIAETGRNEDNNTETDIYFGFSCVEIAPITSAKVSGLNVTEITSVEVLDGITENAVQIEKDENSDKYVINFLSNYYDTVRIKVTYRLDNGGTASGIMKLNRVGIMISGGMTAGDSHTVDIFHGHNSGAVLDASVYDAYKSAHSDKEHGEYKFAYYATYYYPTSSQTTSADVSLFVTYTYADGTVERKLLVSDYFTEATEEHVAMSDYILYMGDGSNAPVQAEVIAVPNAGADGLILGAKLGAGKGVKKVFDFSY